MVAAAVLSLDSSNCLVCANALAIICATISGDNLSWVLLVPACFSGSGSNFIKDCTSCNLLGVTNG